MRYEPTQLLRSQRLRFAQSATADEQSATASYKTQQLSDGRLCRTQPFRAAPTRRLNRRLQIDRTNLVLRDLVAMQADVEALGHGCMTDRKTLEMMVELANVPNRRPIRGRFGHPGISENATGKQVMVSHNYRVAEDERGTFLVHDAQLLRAARRSPAFGQDPIEYILTIAETAPGEFAESVVIDAYQVWTRLGPSGVAEDVPIYVRDAETGYWRENPRPDDALTALPVLRPTKFYYCDFVNEGALTYNGLFSMDAQSMFDGHSSAYARELYDLVDRWRAAYRIGLDELPAKVNAMVQKYMASRHERHGGAIQSAKEPMMAKTLSAQVDELETDGFGFEDEVAELELPKTPNEIKTDTSLEQSQRALKAAEQLAGTLSAGEQRIEHQSRFVTAAEYLTLQQLVEAQGERLRELSAQVRKTAELLARSMNSLATVQRNMLRVEGEPVIAAQVPMNGNLNPLEPLPFGAPMPSQQPALPRSAQATQSAEQKAIEAQQRRARAAR